MTMRTALTSRIAALCAVAVLTVCMTSANVDVRTRITAKPSDELSPLRVHGNRLVNALTEPVTLRGVNQMGLEYSCVQSKGLFDGPADTATVEAIKSWGTNAVRLPLNEHCWLGIAGEPSGEAYRQGVASYVSLLLAGGFYVILDLHWSAGRGRLAETRDPMPNADHSVRFWMSVAGRFKGDDRVIFDLFNEPVPNSNAKDATEDAARRSWECWRDGAVSGGCDPVQLNDMPGRTVVGMQSLLDAVRAAGATNVVMLGGIQFANTLWSSPRHNWLTYKPVDPLNNLVASWHVYDVTWCRTVLCFEHEVGPVSVRVPVVASEIGNHECDALWMKVLLTWLERWRVGYLAWVWKVEAESPCHDLKLIADHAGTPSAYGQIFKAHLADVRVREAPGRREHLRR